MKYVYRPLRDTYRANLCGLDFGPEDGQIKPGAVVDMDPSDERFQNWNEHVSGADGGPCFVPLDESAPKAKPEAAPAAKGKPGPKAKADKPVSEIPDPGTETT